jgi:hypothetical protein
MKAWILVDFKVHQDFIAKVLCINKDKPMSNCNGKCILAQKLKKAAEPEKKELPAALKDRTEINLYMSDIIEFMIRPQNLNNSFNHIKSQTLFNSDYYDDVFHPPKG